MKVMTPPELCSNADGFMGSHGKGSFPTNCDACYDYLDSVGRLNEWEGESPTWLNVTKIAALVREQGEECIVEHRGGNIFTLCAGPVVAMDIDTHAERYVVIGCGGSGDRDAVASGMHDVTCYRGGFEIIPDYSVDEQHDVIGNGPEYEIRPTEHETEDEIAATIVAKIRERTNR